MLILAKAVLALMIGFVSSIVFGYVLIKFLKRMHVGQNVSIFLKKNHSSKDGTPTMGGLIFIIPTIFTVIVLLLMGKMDFSENLFILLFVFIAHAILGFMDDYLSIKRHNNEGLTEIQKLAGQLFISLIFFYIFMKSGGDPVLDIHTLNIRIEMGWFYGIFLLFILVASSNAVNLTDGLDGLAGGLSFISFLAMGIIAWGSTWAIGNEDMAIFCFILVGSLLGFLFYNTYPAKVFMGDTGSLALGAALATVAILTSHELTLVIIAGVFVVETLSSIIQILSIKFRGRKIFLMTPLHHHFEKLGWAEQDIVKLFYFFGLLLCMASIAFGVWL